MWRFEVTTPKTVEEYMAQNKFIPSVTRESDGHILAWKSNIKCADGVKLHFDRGQASFMFKQSILSRIDALKSIKTHRFSMSHPDTPRYAVVTIAALASSIDSDIKELQALLPGKDT